MANWNAPAPNKQTAQKVLEKLRFKLNDTTINKYSNTELMIALNEGIHLLWEALAANYSTLTRRIKAYTLQPNIGALLPDDYYSLVELQDMLSLNHKPGELDVNMFNRNHKNRHLWEPRVHGEHVYGWGEVRLIYNYIPREVTLLDDVVDVPKALVPDIVAITSNIITRDMAAARTRVDEAARRMSQFREFAKVKDMRCFP